MKKIVLMCAAVAMLCACTKSEERTYRVTVEHPHKDCPVVVTEVPAWAESVVVKADGVEIPSQLDKCLAEAAFVADVESVKEFEVVFSEKPSTTEYAPRTNAQMWWKTGDEANPYEEKDTLYSFKDDMYRKLHHHGPAIESEWGANRVYFDKKLTFDTYGMK